MKTIYLLSFKGLYKEGYIGETSKKLSSRKAGHKTDSKIHNSKKAKWLRKYLEQSYKLKIEALDTCDNAQSLELEASYIELYIKKGWTLCNTKKEGYNLSSEHRAKLRENMLGRYNKAIIAINIETKEKTNFKSIREASSRLGISKASIAKCVRGERPTAGGYTWGART